MCLSTPCRPSGPCDDMQCNMLFWSSAPCCLCIRAGQHTRSAGSLSLGQAARAAGREARGLRLDVRSTCGLSPWQGSSVARAEVLYSCIDQAVMQLMQLMHHTQARSCSSPRASHGMSWAELTMQLPSCWAAGTAQVTQCRGMPEHGGPASPQPWMVRVQSGWPAPRPGWQPPGAQAARAPCTGALAQCYVQWVIPPAPAAGPGLAPWPLNSAVVVRA
jgi:hypothetical protein